MAQRGSARRFVAGLGVVRPGSRGKRDAQSDAQSGGVAGGGVAGGGVVGGSVAGDDTSGTAFEHPLAEKDAERDLGRLVTFSDAVVAIAITLIVLPLVESAREHGSQPAIEYLRSDTLNILAAALSFVVIATFWKQHHRLYKHVERSAPGLVNSNLLWLAGIIFLPVPSVLILGFPGADSLASSMYIITIVVSQVGVRIQELQLVRANSFEPGYAPVTRYLWAHWITVALTVAALFLSIAVPNLGPVALVVLLLSRPINRLVRRHQTSLERERRVL
ncbi:TMEM175 family protein [Subtercola lobariae]|uniref:DUF1211 domain-containing protein n=1 Tax=Subtercola lobariae TaxID=1588641 RepID=A0A917F0T6_9MICO|nr:TMEM175 family protein [Subtercola lobariae]GGF31513.1 hypothetical protein GCM10011399_25850 [Subtercola lobariae]